MHKAWCRMSLFVALALAALLIGCGGGSSDSSSSGNTNCLPSYGADCLSLYDNFSSGTIDPARWPTVTATNSGDSVSVVSNELLEVVLDDDGTALQRARVLFANAASIVAIAGKVRVDAFTLSGAAFGRVRITGQRLHGVHNLPHGFRIQRVQHLRPVQPDDRHAVFTFHLNSHGYLILHMSLRGA